MLKLLRRAIRTLGFDVTRYPPYEPTNDPRDAEILARIKPFTMTSVRRQTALIAATRYLATQAVQGSIVECGVWRGGSSMAVAMTLVQENDTNREIFLYDTFEGMTPPIDADKTQDGVSAQEHLARDVRRQGVWCIAGIEDVKRNMALTSYPNEKLRFVKGPVETTIPATLPSSPIALLRLDTDWYESTKHELEYLFPLLCSGGVLILDDYGHWQGARKAVDEYLSQLAYPYYLHPLDYSGRLMIKL